MSVNRRIALLLPLALLVGCAQNEALFHSGRDRFLKADRRTGETPAAQAEAVAAHPPREPAIKGPVAPALKIQPAGPKDIKAFEQAVEDVTALKYGKAIERFKLLLPRFEKAELHRYSAETLFWLGYCSERLKDIAKAKMYYMRASYTYPDTPGGRQARMRLGIIEP
jgi:TolA-binding protein